MSSQNGFNLNELSSFLNNGITYDLILTVDVTVFQIPEDSISAILPYHLGEWMNEEYLSGSTKLHVSSYTYNQTLMPRKGRGDIVNSDAEVPPPPQQPWKLI